MENKDEQSEAEAENDLAEKQMELYNMKNQLESTQKMLDESQSEVKNLQSDVCKLRETANRLEAESLDYRKKFLAVSDERDELTRLLERRNNELTTLQEENKNLAKQAKEAIASKYEVLLKIDELDSREAALDRREQLVAQEREMRNRQIENLNEDLAKHAEQVRNLRIQNAANVVQLEAQLVQKKEENSLLEQRVEELSEANTSLQKKIEALSKQLLEQRESEAKLQESFGQEIRAQTKLANLYKGISEEEKLKSEELVKRIKELEELLNEAREQNCTLEARLEDTNAKHLEAMAKKQDAIDALQEELQRANELIQVAKSEALDKSLEMSPEASHVSRLMKSGMTTTQLYMQYADVSEKLLLEKENNRKLNLYLSTIVKEIEEKAPILQQQRLEYESILEKYQTISQLYEEAMAKVNFVTAEANEATRSVASLKREIKRHQEDKDVLSRQVCFLVKELEEARSVSSTSVDISSFDISSSHPEDLVTFSSIEELQLNNQKLLAKVRELNSRTEPDEERESEELKELKDRLDTYHKKIEQLSENDQKCKEMMDVLLRQRDMYRNLYHQAKNGQNVSDTSSAVPATAEHMTSFEKDSSVKELIEVRKALQEALSEAATYREERQAHEKQLIEQLETAQSELHKLRSDHARLLAQAEYSERCAKTLKESADVYRSQVDALEKRTQIYIDSLAKHEKMIVLLKDEAVDAQKKLAKAEVQLENTKQECELLRESNSRLEKEREMYDRENRGQSTLMANLECIRTSLERADTEAKMRLEARLDDALRECSALRRRMQEEEENFRELTKQLKQQTEVARQREEEERKIGMQARTELISARTELNRLNEELLKQQMRVKELSKPPSQDISAQTKELNSKLKHLELQIVKKDSDLNMLQKELNEAKEHMQKYCEISQASEQRLKELSEEKKSELEIANKRFMDESEKTKELQKKVEHLEAELKKLKSAPPASQIIIKKESDVQMEEPSSQLAQVKTKLEETLKALEDQRLAAKAAEEKYAREVLLHSQDLQELTAVRQQLGTLELEITQLRASAEQAELKLTEGLGAWDRQEQLLRGQIQELQERLSGLDIQNSALHEQIEALSHQLAIAKGEQPSTTGTSQLEEQENQDSSQLLKIIKFLRREKDLAVGQFEVLRTENLRLKAQLENMEQQLKQIKNLQSEKKQEDDASVISASKHAGLIRKIETLNAITDSNVTLRAERDELGKEVKLLKTKVEALESELGPLRKEKAQLTNQASTLEAENANLRAETGRLRQRVSALIERANKVAPEEWKRLKTEREQLKQDVARLESQNKQQADEIARLTKDLVETKNISSKQNEELAKITEDLGSKEALLSDIRNKEMQVRKIAKKYKTQYEELTKYMEEQKQKWEEERKKAASESMEIPQETQEQYRAEGRREMEQRLQEVETRHSDALRELNEKVTSSHDEAESLRKENETLKVSSSEKEERARVVLKTARQKIMQLTEAKNTLTRQLTEAQERVEVVEQTKEEDSARLISLKSQYEGRIVRLEKENAELRAEKQRENERLQHLQRQLEKLQGSKPSTSSGQTEKSTTEPPTANIKPMAGPSASPKAQQPQQSAAVTPWTGRGETPFASIRPISQQRTVAVMPTAFSSSYNNQSTVSQQQQQSQQQVQSQIVQGTAVLTPIPPQQQQQQAVHSSGSVDAPTPTSSHTDYMPATSTATSSSSSSSNNNNSCSTTSSSAGGQQPVRQATVTPTITGVATPESSEAMEADAAETQEQATTEAATPQTQQPPPSSQQKIIQDQSPQLQQQSQQISLQQQSLQAQSQQQQQPSGSQQNQSQPQQQAVAMVLPRVEVPTSAASAGPGPEQTQSVSASSSTGATPTVTTSQAGVKRPHEEPDNDDEKGPTSQAKRTRSLESVSQEEFQQVTSDSGLDVEYQVPTSSQHDQEDDIGISGGEEDDEGMADEADLSGYDEGNEGPDIDVEAQQDEENNEVDVMGDGNEVPNQSGSSDSRGTIVAADSNDAGSGGGESDMRQPGEATSSGSSGGNSGGGGRPGIPPLPRGQLQLLGYEEVGDDSIVPSTPTLFVPRRNDGFSEAVSSPQVPQQQRFTFSETHPPSTSTSRAAAAQVVTESIDDGRMDLSQLDEGTGRSVPTTPLQVSPQGDNVGVEMSSEIGQSSTDTEHHQPSDGGSANSNIPSISITEASTDEAGEAEAQFSESASDVLELDEPELEHTDIEDQEQAGVSDTVDEGIHGVSSGDITPTEAASTEEGREAEASEQPSGSATHDTSRPMTRQFRSASRARGRSRGGAATRHTPIVWSEPGSSAQRGSPRGRASLMMRGEGIRGSGFQRLSARGRRMRGKPKGAYTGPYQMRF